MSLRRKPLERQLENAWKSTINGRYEYQLINSERGLQVYFCHALMAEFNNNGCRLFVEPRLCATTKDFKYPDIVVCDAHSIVALIEVKYGPRVKALPQASKDIDTLNWAVRNRQNLKISNDRYRGSKSEDRSYPLADEAVLCWAGVYSGNQPLSLRQELGPEAAEHYLQLDALTRKGYPPEVYVNECRCAAR